MSRRILPTAPKLEALAQDRGRYAAEILDKRVSILDLLETYPSCQLSFTSFLQLLTQLTPRRYSISSSPLWSPDHATLTFAVIQAPAWSGRGVFEGASSTYLAQARPGSRVAVTVRPSNAAFHPPPSLAVPLIMVCAGTGLAPFRGFVQDRALRAEAEEHDAGACPAVLRLPRPGHRLPLPRRTRVVGGAGQPRPAAGLFHRTRRRPEVRPGPALGRPGRRRRAGPAGRHGLRLRRRQAHGAAGPGHVRPHLPGSDRRLQGGGRGVDG